MKYTFAVCAFFLLLNTCFAQQENTVKIELIEIQEQIEKDQFKTALTALKQFEVKYADLIQKPSIEQQIFSATQAYFFHRKEVLEEAQIWIEKALVQSTHFPDSLSDLVFTHFVAQGIYENLRLYDQAIEQSETLVLLYNRMGESQLLNLAKAYRKIGVYYQEKNQSSKSLDYLNKALGILSKHRQTPPLQLANLYRAFARSHYLAHEIKLQLSYLNKAIAICRNTNTDESKHLQGQLLGNLGSYYIRNQEYEKGLSFYTQNTAYTTKTFGAVHSMTSTAYMNLGIAYAQCGQLPAAEANFRKAIAVKKQLYGPHNPNVALAYGNLVVLMNMMQRYDDALALSQQSFIASMVGYKDTNVYVPLIPIIEKHELLDPINVIGNLNNRSRALAHLYSQTQDLKYLKFAHETVLAQVAILDKVKMQLSDADKLKVLRRNFMPFQQGVAYAHKLYQKTKDKKYLDEGFQLAERHKDAILTAALSSKNALAFGDIPDSLVQEENALKLAISTTEKKLLNLSKSDSLHHDLQEELFALKLKKETFVEQLEETYPQYVQLKYKSTIANIKSISDKTLSEESLFISYYISDLIIYIWKIGQEEVDFISFELDSLYQQDIAEFRKVLTNLAYVQNNSKKAAATYQNLSYKFYEQFLAPVLKNSQAKHLIIAPDHLLGHLPFEAFCSKKVAQSSPDYQKNPYLINDYEIQYTYSGTLLLQNKQQYDRKNSRVTLLGIAATYDRNNIVKEGRSTEAIQLRKALVPLPEANNEVKALETLFDGQFLYGTAANEQDFKKIAADYGVIHLAMHGILNPKNPVASSLVFTEDGNQVEDNFLQASEITHLHLKAQLVVLSACETGYGKFERGEGVMSLARSFMHAGVPSLVVSLWQVNDYSTSKIMELFYDGLKKGMTKSAALRAAKLSYIERAEGLAAHPALWAAFIQLGNREALHLNQTSFFTLGHAILLGGFLLLMLFIVIWKRKR